MSPRCINAQARLRAELDRLALRDLFRKSFSFRPKIQTELELTVLEHTELMIENAENYRSTCDGR